MNLFYQPALPAVKFLDLEESKHCIKVLRKTVSDSIQVIDGHGNLYEAVITAAHHKKCEFEVKSIVSQPKNKIHRHIAIAPTKSIDRLEWFVEKAVEIGIDEITFFKGQHSERAVLKMDRLQKKAVSAMKQSYKFHAPQLNELATFQSIIKAERQNTLKTIAFVDFDNPTQLKSLIKNDQNIFTLIGPEGDFSEEEVKLAEEAGFVKVALGTSRLRTETAGIVACHLMNLVD